MQGTQSYGSLVPKRRAKEIYFDIGNGARFENVCMTHLQFSLEHEQ